MATSGNALPGIDERPKMTTAQTKANFHTQLRLTYARWHVDAGGARAALLTKQGFCPAFRCYHTDWRFRMPTCKSCGEDVSELVSARVGGKTKKLCEDCADKAREEAEVAEASEGVVQQMMEFKGRRGS
jgi:hypothetical protein